MAGITERLSDRQIRSLYGGGELIFQRSTYMAGRGRPGRSLLHDKEKRALQRLRTRRKPTAIRIVSSYIRRPHDEMWSARSQSLLWAALVTRCQGRSHNFSTWWSSRGRCQGHPMIDAELNTRRQGMEGFRRNSNDTEPTRQVHGRLKANSKGLILEVRRARDRGKKGGKGQRRRTSGSKPALQNWMAGLDPLKVAKRKLQMLEMPSRRRSSSVPKRMWPSHDVRRKGI